MENHIKCDIKDIQEFKWCLDSVKFPYHTEISLPGRDHNDEVSLEEGLFRTDVPVDHQKGGRQEKELFTEREHDDSIDRILSPFQ